jgi:hypothetical protein
MSPRICIPKSTAVDHKGGAETSTGIEDMDVRLCICYACYYHSTAQDCTTLTCASVPVPHTNPTTPAIFLLALDQAEVYRYPGTEPRICQRVLVPVLQGKSQPRAG